MKLTKQKLKQIIKEELNLVLEDQAEHIAGIEKKMVKWAQRHQQLKPMCNRLEDWGDPKNDAWCDELSAIEEKIYQNQKQLARMGRPGFEALDRLEQTLKPVGPLGEVLEKTLSESSAKEPTK
jgi:chromosome segregation ATPase